MLSYTHAESAGDTGSLTEEKVTMGAAEQRNKDKAHAAYMKEHGVMRRTGQCGLGHHLVSVPMDSHFSMCKGPAGRVRPDREPDVPAPSPRVPSLRQAIASAESHAGWVNPSGEWIEKGSPHPVTYYRPTDAEHAEEYGLRRVSAFRYERVW